LIFYIGNTYDPAGIFGTASSVDVMINGNDAGTFTNKCGKGTTVQCWRKFTVDFVAAGAQTTIDFINADPSTDTQNGLDAVSVVADPD
jgi:hypothetical protein